MKKIISFSILIVIIVLVLCGCDSKSLKEDKFLCDFVVIKEFDEGFLGDCLKIIYDKNTKIVYMYLQGGYRAGLSPYYVIVNGEPTIAIYGVNYEYQE